jgi:hypothetical protein
MRTTAVRTQWRDRCVALAVGVAGLTLGVDARAQPRAPTAQELETARTLYKEGKELRTRGDLRGALEKLQAAHALGNTPVTGIELARTFGMLSLLVEARETCLAIARIPVASDETEKSAQARVAAAKIAEELRPRIPTLLVKVDGVLRGEKPVVWIDDDALPQAAMGEPQKVDPGRHQVVVRAGEGRGAREARGVAEVSEAETGEVALTLPPVTFPPAEAPPQIPAPSSPRTSPFVGVGVATAIAGSAVGAIAGFLALDKKNALASECSVSRACDTLHGGSSDLATARRWATASTVAFSVAGVGAVVALVALLTRGQDPPPQSAHASVWVGLGPAGFYGSF